MISKFVLIFVLSTGVPGNVPFDVAGYCLAAKDDMAKKLGTRLSYAECFPTGRE